MGQKVQPTGGGKGRRRSALWSAWIGTIFKENYLLTFNQSYKFRVQHIHVQYDTIFWKFEKIVVLITKTT